MQTTSIQIIKHLLAGGLLCAAVLILRSGDGFAQSAPSALSAPSPSEQGVEKIVAIVNDEIISEFDLDQRIRLVFASTGVRPTADMQARVKSEILDSLIDEKLQVQEANEFDMVIDAETLQGAVSYIAQQNQSTAEEFQRMITSSGISWRVYLNQLYAELVWDRLVRARFSSRVSISDEEVEAYLDRLKENADKPENRIAEIFLAVDSPDQDRRVYETAMRLSQQLREGARFQAVAQQFSQSPSAAVGGDVGWVYQGELAPEIDAALDRIQPGQLTEPVRTVAGYYIMLLIDQRIRSKGDIMKTRLSLAKLSVPVGQEADLQALTAMDCKAAKKAARANDNASYVDLGVLQLGDLSEQLRDSLMDKQAGQTTDAAEKDGRVEQLLVCARRDDKPKLPTRDQVSANLSNRQIALMARRYLRDLRRDATIEYR